MFKVMICVLIGLFALIFFTNVPLTVFTFIPEIEMLVQAAGFKPKRWLIGVCISTLMFSIAIPRQLNEQLILALSAAFFTNYLSFGFPGIYGTFYCKTTKERLLGAALYVFSGMVLIAQLAFIVYSYGVHGKL